MRTHPRPTEIYINQGRRQKLIRHLGWFFRCLLIGSNLGEKHTYIHFLVIRKAYSRQKTSIFCTFLQISFFSKYYLFWKKTSFFIENSAPKIKYFPCRSGPGRLKRMRSMVWLDENKVDGRERRLFLSMRRFLRQYCLTTVS